VLVEALVCFDSSKYPDFSEKFTHSSLLSYIYVMGTAPFFTLSLSLNVTLLF